MLCQERRKNCKRKFQVSTERCKRLKREEHFNFMGLPEEVVIYVFSYSSAFDLLNLSCVNTGLHFLSSCNEIWTPLYAAVWKAPPTTSCSILTLPSSFSFPLSESSLQMLAYPSTPGPGETSSGSHGIVAFLRAKTLTPDVLPSSPSTPPAFPFPSVKSAFFRKHGTERIKLGFSRVDAEQLTTKIKSHLRTFECNPNTTLRTLIRDVLYLSRWFATLFRFIHMAYTHLQLLLQTCYDRIYQMIKEQNALKLGVNTYTRFSHKLRSVCGLTISSLVVEFLGSVQIDVPTSLLGDLEEIRAQASWLSTSIEFLSNSSKELITKFRITKQKISPSTKSKIWKDSSTIEQSLCQMAETYARTRNLIATCFF